MNGRPRQMKWRHGISENSHELKFKSLLICLHGILGFVRRFEKTIFATDDDSSIYIWID